MIDEETNARLLNPHPNVAVETASDPEQFAEKVPQADGVIVFHFGIPKEALQPGSRLRWIHSIPTGVDDLLTPEVIAAEHVAITASKGPHAPLIAEHMVLLLLSLARQVPALIKDQEEHRWTHVPRGDVHRITTQMLGKTIAILGVGQIGDNLARMCKAGFGMKVLGMSRTTRDSKYVDRYFNRSELHEALGEADVVALCLSLTPSTENIIGKAELEAMKPTGILVNEARGGLIDEDALVEAMCRGTIGGAALDSVTSRASGGEQPPLRPAQHHHNLSRRGDCGWRRQGGRKLYDREYP